MHAKSRDQGTKDTLVDEDHLDGLSSGGQVCQGPTSSIAYIRRHDVSAEHRDERADAACVDDGLDSGPTPDCEGAKRIVSIHTDPFVAGIFKHDPHDCHNRASAYNLGPAPALAVSAQRAALTMASCASVFNIFTSAVIVNSGMFDGSAFVVLKLALHKGQAEDRTAAMHFS